MTLIGKWILHAAGAAVFCAIASELTPPGSIRAVQRFLCGTVMALALLSPIFELDFDGYSLKLAEYRKKAGEITLSAGEISDELSRVLIQEKCAAYIMDKAAELGLAPDGAEVELRWGGEGVWYPVSAEIDCEYDERLSRTLEAELGIASDKQKWSGE